MFYVAGPSRPDGGIASQSTTGATNSAWSIRRIPFSGENFFLMANSNGSDDFAGQTSITSPPIIGAQTLALSIQQNNGSGQRVVTSKSFDGSAWTTFATGTSTAQASMAASTEPLRVGATGSSVNQFTGQVFWVELRTGLDPTAGGSSMAVPGYIALPATAGNYLSVPDETALDITGDICIVARIYRAAWTGATSRSIVSKWGAAIGSYRMGLRNDGFLTFNWSADGSTALLTASTANVAATPVNSWLGVAVSFDAVSGADRQTKFWTSTDMMTWTQLGSTVTGTSGATAILPSADPLRIGSVNSFDSTMFDGNVGYVSVRDGIGAGNTVGGTERFRFEGTNLYSSMSTAATSFKASTGQTVTINRSGSPQTTIVPTVDGVLWRFDAQDHVSGTSWTDPRGRTWTVPSSSAIVHDP